jgi:hypothetical protein
MLKLVYKMDTEDFIMADLIRKRENIVQRRIFYEIHFWLTIALLTYANTVLYESFTHNSYGALISTLVTLILMILPTLLFYIRKLITKKKLDHIESLYALQRYDLIVYFIYTIDSIVFIVMILCLVYALFQ